MSSSSPFFSLNSATVYRRPQRHHTLCGWQTAKYLHHHKKHLPSLIPEKVFSSFIHNLIDLATGSNERYCCRTFTPKDDGVIHGIAGYFEAVLYENVTLSNSQLRISILMSFLGIHPDRHSPNMFSWFPMVFPLNIAIPVKAGQDIKLHLWRCVSSRHVWYEWAITEPQTSKIHNSGGAAYKIGL